MSEHVKYPVTILNDDKSYKINFICPVFRAEDKDGWQLQAAAAFVWCTYPNIRDVFVQGSVLLQQICKTGVMTVKQVRVSLLNLLSHRGRTFNLAALRSPAPEISVGGFSPCLHPRLPKTLGWGVVPQRWWD